MRLLVMLSLLSPLAVQAQTLNRSVPAAQLLPAAVAADTVIAPHWNQLTEEGRNSLLPTLQAHAECGPQRESLAKSNPATVKRWLQLLATRNDILARAQANNSFIQQTQQQAKARNVPPESLLTPEQTADVLHKSNQLREEKAKLDTDFQQLMSSSPEPFKILMECERIEDQLKQIHQTIRQLATPVAATASSTTP